MKNIQYILLAAITLIGSTLSAQNKSVIDIGGMGLAEAIDETHFVAALTGEFSDAYAEIISQKETPTGLELVMEHYFVNDDNGLIRTRDKAILNAVQGKLDTYILEAAPQIMDRPSLSLFPSNPYDAASHSTTKVMT